MQPLVSIVIPHYNGKGILYKCLACIAATKYENLETIVVDNASTDSSLASMATDFPQVKVVYSNTNSGYAGGCNTGFEHAAGELILFLNNDTEFAPDWLDKLVAAIGKDERIAACQPKLLALANQDTFDYSGAAGGLLDKYGFPFARGRIFFTLEKDTQQYDQSADIFWASGTATLVRRTALEAAGNFDEDFFAHMEEIDLNWRFHLHGFRVVAVPQSVVLHNSGSTLRPDSFKKMYLNHRNSLSMLLKNYQLRTLVWAVPVRLSLEGVAVFYSLLKLDFVRVAAIFAAFFSVILRCGSLVAKRRKVQSCRKVADSQVFRKMLDGSIVWLYFVRRVRRTQDLGAQAVLA